VRLMSMGRISTSVYGECWRMAFARGRCIYHESFVRCGRGRGPCSISIPLSESFNRGVSSAAIGVSVEYRLEKPGVVGFV
jgi:hypothetical protein